MTKRTTLVFLSTAILYLALLPWSTPLDWLLKILPILALGLAAVQAPSIHDRPLILTALVFSACGDVLLEIDLFIAGVAAFLLAQACYAVLFYRFRESLHKRWPASVLLCGYIILMAAVLLPSLGDLTIPVMAYLLVISVMGLLALQSRLPLNLAVLGALVFIASDSLIAINKFIQPLPLSSLWIMITYYAAQWLLVAGFLSARTDRQGQHHADGRQRQS